MHLNTGLALPLLATLASASVKAKRSACVPDQCYTTLKSSGPTQTLDCSSFLLTTVSQCPTTTTSISTTTITESPSFATFTAIANNTLISTLTESALTFVETIEDTATIIEPTTIEVTNVIVTPITVTENNPVFKRAATIQPLPANPTIPPNPVFRRFITTNNCTAATIAPTDVPAYASACSNSSQYASACSRIGVSASTTTLPRSTSTVVSTSTVYTIPIQNTTITATNNFTFVQTQTQFIPTTFETTDATLIIPSATTIETDIVIPTTVVVSPPVCSSYQFVVTNGARAGQFITANDPSDPNAVSYGFVSFTSDPSQAHDWIVRDDGRVYSSDNTFGWVTRNNALYYVLEMSDNSEATYKINYLHCSISDGASTYPGAVGLLSCMTDAGNPTNLAACVNTGNNLVQAPNVPAAGNGCSALNLAVVPAC